jgi:TonB family protein
MRVLVVDQDSASNQAISRSLREHFVVDAVTNKGDCLDLLRSNAFEAIVAGERLEDGSGLELLGQISKKYPSILRIFAADRHRLKLLKGRLGPFDLFQTLTYPIDPERLLATLLLADAAQDAHADTSNIQHVELSGTLETEEAPEQPDAFPASQPEPRAAAAARRESDSPPGPAPGHRKAATRNGASPKPQPRTGSGQRPRRASTTASASGRPALGTPATRTGTAGQALSSGGGASPRHGRARPGSNKAPPVRFPPLEPPQQAPPPDSFAETAAMARQARDNLDETSDEVDYKRIAVLVGSGAVILLGVIVLGFKLFGSKSEAPKLAATPQVHAPEYPQQVTDLIAQTEEAFKADNFKIARDDVDKLRQLAPSHPRLAFFNSLLAQKVNGSKSASADATRGGAGGHGSAKHGPRKGSAGTDDDKSLETGGQTTSGAAGGASVSGSTSGSAAGASQAGADLTGMASSGAAAPPQTSSGFAPETPPGVSRAASTDSAASPGVASAAGSATSAPVVAAPAAAVAAPATAATSVTAATPVAANATTPASAQSSGSSSARRSSADEPPPVVQEAKLIRRVNPDYPSAAKKEGIEGSVDLQVTVSQQGVVRDATVVSSTPPDVFDKAALTAVRKWKYDPRFVDGLASEAQLKVHLDFKPGQ